MRTLFARRASLFPRCSSPWAQKAVRAGVKCPPDRHRPRHGTAPRDPKVSGLRLLEKPPLPNAKQIRKRAGYHDDDPPPVGRSTASGSDAKHRGMATARVRPDPQSSNWPTVRCARFVRKCSAARLRARPTPILSDITIRCSGLCTNSRWDESSHLDFMEACFAHALLSTASPCSPKNL